ncbi:MAG: dienelactone hydrolase family protein [Chloroflexi bacterium]|nr:dienelactone hydrolase family protein [Chloroflexota bacterium]
MDFSTTPAEDYVLTVYEARASQQPDGTFAVVLRTSRGNIAGLLHMAENQPGAVLFGSRFTSTGGGPANGLYTELAQELWRAGVTCLRVFYRTPGAEPGPFEECVLDMLGGVSFLRALGVKAMGVVGHSFSGAVAIKAATLSPHISAVVALASQLYGAKQVEQIAPRPILLAHGTDDTVLEYRSSQLIYEHAKEPKEIVLYEGAGHSLVECREPLKEKMAAWLLEHLGPQALARP